MPDRFSRPFPMFPQDPLTPDDPRLSGRTVQTFAPWQPSGVTEDGFIDVYTEEIALGRFGDGKCPPIWWTVQIHALEVCELTPDAGSSSLSKTAVTTEGKRVSKLKARLNWQDRSGGGKNSGNTVDVDIGAGVTLQVGPCQRLDVSILAPTGTIQVQGEGEGSSPNGILETLDSLVSVSAAAYPYPSVPRKARLSHVVIVPTLLNAVIPIPAGAVECTVYQNLLGPRTIPSLAGNPGGVVDLGQGNISPIIFGSRFTHFPCLPGQATHVQTGAAGGGARAYSMVYRLEY